MTPPRVYVDTSVFGGCFDEEFQDVSRSFFDQAREHRFKVVTSATVQQEIVGAPSDVAMLFDETLAFAEVLDVSPEALLLQQAYLDARILAPKWSSDALHVALATVSRCAMIVSWNFKHIVHFEKIGLYNEVNLRNGYSEIRIFSPLEVVAYEDEEDL